MWKAVNPFERQLLSLWQLRSTRHKSGRSRLRRSPILRRNQPRTDHCSRLHFTYHQRGNSALGCGRIAVAQWRSMAGLQTRARYRVAISQFGGVVITQGTTYTGRPNVEPT